MLKQGCHIMTTPRAPISVLVILALAAFTALHAGCKPATPNVAGSQSQSAKAEPAEVRVAPVSVIPTERFLDLTGTLYGQEEVTVSAKVAGRIVAVLADLGDDVDHGGKLAQVDTTDYVLAIEEARSSLRAALARLGLTELPAGQVDLASLPVIARAEAQAANAIARLTRARKLYDRQPPLISEQEFADIQTQSDVAQTEVQSERINAQAQLADAGVRHAALRLAEQRLADASIIAPAELPLRFRVASRRVSVGEYVAAGTPLFRLVAIERVKFRGSVPERFAGQIVVGAPAQLVAEGFAQPFEARVVRISPAIDAASRAFEIEIEASNAEGRLKPGGFLRARVRTGIDQAARYVPAASLSQFTGVQRVFAVRDGKVAEFKVRTGETRGELVEVLDLPSEVTAVISPSRRGLAPGAAVRIAN